MLALFCDMRYIENARFLREDRTTDVVNTARSRHNSVSFVWRLSSANRSELKLKDLIAKKTIENADRRERLYIRYGSEYTFLLIEQALSVNKY